MRIGLPQEIKNHEYRVGLTPASVRELVAHGHQVLVESEAGAGIGMHDSDYRAAGAEVVSVADVFARAEMVVKVKEPQATEIARLRAGQLLFTYLHLAPDPLQAQGLLACGVSAIAYETVTDPRGALPLLAPMSEVAGRLAVQAGTHAKLGVAKPFVQIRSVRGTRKRDLVRNDALPVIEVDPASFEVRADGRLLICEPAKVVPLNRTYLLR
jgi:alanine dehydrogenase